MGGNALRGSTAMELTVAWLMERVVDENRVGVPCFIHYISDIYHVGAVGYQPPFKASPSRENKRRNPWILHSK